MFTVSERLSEWLASRSPRKRHYSLSQKNLYIFPSRVGFVFLALLVLMLVTAINYQSSLIYLFTFILGALFFISIWLCFLNVSGLQIQSPERAECFSGENRPFHIQLVSPDHAIQALIVSVHTDDSQTIDVDSSKPRQLTLYDKPSRRGLSTLKQFRIESVFPFGLVRVWSWIKLDAQVVVYPKPIPLTVDRLGTSESSQGDSRQKTDEQTEIRSYRPGDTSSRILWKQLAAKDRLAVREHEWATTDSRWIRWEDYPVSDPELRLCHMCHDVLSASERREAFGLSLPDKIINPTQGERHKKLCLEALALFSLSEAS